MDRTTFNEVRQKSLSAMGDLVTNLAKEGVTFQEQNLAIISACLVEMNGYLAAIAESLRKEEEE